jgi:sterol desaturase/sphingolipid hydroxylase (fatty acid hydroxylase superfamily)
MLNEFASITALLKTDVWQAVLSGKLATFLLFLVFVILSTLESTFPKRKLPTIGLRQSYRTNINLFMFNSVVLSLVSSSPSFMMFEHWTGSGLLTDCSSPLRRCLVSFLLLDLLLYLWHRASHTYDVLWMLHRVHHNDPCLNVSTAFRIHILEVVIITLLKAVYVVMLGLDKATVLVNEALLTCFVMFHHTNISFKGEQFLGRVLIVPYLHQTHHSTERNEHDNNYGAVLSIWDQLFGTLLESEPARLGIKEDSPMTFSKLVKFGFIRPDKPAELPVNLETMIAEAAYYKAEKRNFDPGYEICDWLEAKNEIFKQICKDRSLAN